MSASRLSLAHSSPLINPHKDRRQFKRVDLEIGGRYLNDNSEDHQLVTQNVSCSGAYLQAATVPVEGSEVICYFDDLGRVAATVIRRAPDGFAVQFNVMQHKREKLADRLTWLVNKSILDTPEERAATRFNIDGPAHFSRKDGKQMPCRVVDISLTGASFEASGPLPAIGEIITAGNLQGRVVRVGDGGFAVSFLRADEKEQPEG